MTHRTKQELWGVVVLLLFASWVPVVIWINEWLGLIVAATAIYLIYELEE